MDNLDSTNPSEVEEDLQQILDFLPLKAGMKILDLGTGSGFLAFAIAKSCPDIFVAGTDVCEKAISENREKTAREDLDNIAFVCFDGIDFPFKDECFDMVIARDTLHCFLNISKTISEISRVLCEDGYFFLSDPAPNEEDINHFADDFAKLKNDNHRKFYSKTEWKYLAIKNDFMEENFFETATRFSLKKAEATGIEKLLKRQQKSIYKSYSLEEIDDEIYIIQRVNNILFSKI